MVKYTQTILWQKPTNCVSIFDHFLGLAFKGISLFTGICFKDFKLNEMNWFFFVIFVGMYLLNVINYKVFLLDFQYLMRIFFQAFFLAQLGSWVLSLPGPCFPLTHDLTTLDLEPLLVFGNNVFKFLSNYILVVLI